MKPRTKSMIWNTRKQKATSQNNKKKKESKKYEDSISSLWDNFKRSTSHIIGVPEGEEKEQEIGNLLEKIMRKIFSGLLQDTPLLKCQMLKKKRDS